MNWSRRSSDRESSSLKRALFFTIIVVAVGMIDVGLGGQLRSFARDALTPFANSMTTAWRSFLTFSDLSTRVDLLERVQVAEDEAARLKERDALFQFLARENAELRDIARVAGTVDSVTAPIASSFRASPYGTFVVAAGWQSGVEEGALVLSSEGFVLGTIADVGLRTATVRFVFAPEARVEATSDANAFTLIGQGLTTATARVPVETPLVIGAPVYIPSLNSLPAGIITHIASTTASVYADIYVTLPTSLNSIRHIRIVPRDLPTIPE